MFLKLEMPKRKPESSEDVNPTRQKLENTPFKTAAEMNEASREIQLQVWKRLEYSRVLQQMISNDGYKFIQEELKQGLSCGYGEEGTDLVRVFSEGVGVRIAINRDLAEVDKSELFVEALIRSTADSFSRSYYQIKGMLPVESSDPQDIKKPKR
jgi:hypothetical protein